MKSVCAKKLQCESVYFIKICEFKGFRANKLVKEFSTKG